MLRKLISVLTVFALALVGLAQTSPAQAWPDSTTAVSTLTSADSRWEIGALGKTLSSNMVFAYMGSSNDIKYIRSYTLSPEGALTAPVDVVRGESPDIYYSFSPSETTWVDKRGTIHLVFTRKDMGQVSRTSKLMHVTSQDGLVWTAPIEIYSIPYQATDNCAQPFDLCGIDHVSLSHTSAGQIAIAFSILKSDATRQLLFSTKLSGKSWINPAVINTSNYEPYDLDLLATDKGFVASWVNNYGLGAHLMSSFSTGLTAKTWTAPQERYASQGLGLTDLIQISPTKYAVVYSDRPVNPSETIVSMQSFDTRTNRFASAQQILTLPSTAFLDNISTTEYRAGQSAIAFTALSTDLNEGDARYILFRNGKATSQFVNQALATPSGVTQTIQKASMDDLGHLSIVWFQRGPTQPDDALYLSQFFRGNRSDVLLGNEIATYNVGFSQDGDVYVSSFLMSTISGFVRIRSDAPTLTTDVSVTGTSKVGKALTTKLPMIDADSVGQKWLYSYQWYSCQFQVTEVLAIATENCSAISGATAATYKVKPADKGKFLQVRLNVKSDNATQTQYSASTVAAK